MDLFAEGVKQKLIRFEDDNKYIVYVHQDKRRNYTNPEEQVQAESFLRLVLTYKYPVKRIRQFVSVKMPSTADEVLAETHSASFARDGERRKALDWLSFICVF